VYSFSKFRMTASAASSFFFSSTADLWDENQGQNALSCFNQSVSLTQ
jgi:hypothetical protein